MLNRGIEQGKLREQTCLGGVEDDTVGGRVGICVAYDFGCSTERTTALMYIVLLLVLIIVE